MEELISELGNIAYRYDEGERPDFDAYIERLSAFGLPKDYFLSARYRFANANMMKFLAVCFRRPRYRVLR